MHKCSIIILVADLSAVAAFLGRAAGGGLRSAYNSIKNGLSLISNDRKFSITPTGRLHPDLGFRPQSVFAGLQTPSSSFDAKYARIGVVGHVYDRNFTFTHDSGGSQDTTLSGMEMPSNFTDPCART